MNAAERDLLSAIIILRTNWPALAEELAAWLVRPALKRAAPKRQPTPTWRKRHPHIMPTERSDHGDQSS